MILKAIDLAIMSEYLSVHKSYKKIEENQTWKQTI